jgi:carbonic anhydrase
MPCAHMERILQGIRRFRSDVFPALRTRFESLVKDGQQPRTLLIGCADSRVPFETLLDVGPGELFIVRVAGNIVPRYGTYVGGVTASIEFAVTQLPISDVIVCGHSHCGAMRAILEPDRVRDLPAVRDWVGFSDDVRQRVHDLGPELTEAERVDRAVKTNVVLALENLRTFPCVQDRLAAKAIRLHGWTFEIETGRVFEHDDVTKAWRDLSA